MNAIIHASREAMLGGVLYLSAGDAKTNEIIDAEPCKMCKKLIINAGIKEVIAKTKDGNINIFNVEDWIRKGFIFPK